MKFDLAFRKIKASDEQFEPKKQIKIEKISVKIAFFLLKNVY